MDKNKEKKIISGFSGKIRRENELKMYGKILSLRPSVCHKSKKLYNRKNYKLNLNEV